MPALPFSQCKEQINTYNTSFLLVAHVSRSLSIINIYFRIQHVQMSTPITTITLILWDCMMGMRPLLQLTVYWLNKKLQLDVLILPQHCIVHFHCTTFLISHTMGNSMIYSCSSKKLCVRYQNVNTNDQLHYQVFVLLLQQWTTMNSNLN